MQDITYSFVERLVSLSECCAFLQSVGFGGRVGQSIPNRGCEQLIVCCITVVPARNLKLMMLAIGGQLVCGEGK